MPVTVQYIFEGRVISSASDLPQYTGDSVEIEGKKYTIMRCDGDKCILFLSGRGDLR